MQNETSDPAARLSRLRSEDEARAWVLELIELCERTRRAIDVCGTVREQRALFCRWLMYDGQALGVVSSLFRCGLLSENAYRDLRQRVIETQKPTVVPFFPAPARW